MEPDELIETAALRREMDEAIARNYAAEALALTSDSVSQGRTVYQEFKRVESNEAESMLLKEVMPYLPIRSGARDYMTALLLGLRAGSISSPESASAMLEKAEEAARDYKTEPMMLFADSFRLASGFSDASGVDIIYASSIALRCVNRRAMQGAPWVSGKAETNDGELERSEQALLRAIGQGDVLANRDANKEAEEDAARLKEYVDTGWSIINKLAVVLGGVWAFTELRKRRKKR